jgi:LysR family transcriptional regulator for metE and metH
VRRIAAQSPTPSLPRPQLEIRDLDLVLALASAQTTVAAAQMLHLTQSAVSRALTQAEERIGVRLFERSARGLLPTAAGLRLLAGAAPLLRQLHELERAVAAPEREPERVRLVCECYTAYRWLPSAMASLRERWSDLLVEVASDYTGDPVSALVSGKIDVALLTTGQLPKGEGLREAPLFTDEVVFAMSKHHALAKNRSLTPRQLQAAVLISGNTPAAEARWFTRSVFGRRRPKLSFLRFPLSEAIMDAARAGMGIAVLSEWVASGYLETGELVLRRLASGPLQRPWRIAYREDAAAVLERLKGVLVALVPHLRVAG